MIEPSRGDARWECRGRNFYHLRCLPTAGGMDPTQVTGFSDLRAEDQAAAREHIRTSPRPSLQLDWRLISRAERGYREELMELELWTVELEAVPAVG